MQKINVQEVIYDDDSRLLTFILPNGRRVSTDLRYDTGMARTMVRGQLLQEQR